MLKFKRLGYKSKSMVNSHACLIRNENRVVCSRNNHENCTTTVSNIKIDTGTAVLQPTRSSYTFSQLLTFRIPKDQIRCHALLI